MSYEAVAAFCGREVVLLYAQDDEPRKVFAEEVRNHDNGNKTLLCSSINETGNKSYRSFSLNKIQLIG
jgi:hypothetical protein